MNEQIAYAQGLMLVWCIIFIITMACIAISKWRARQLKRLIDRQKINPLRTSHDRY